MPGATTSRIRVREVAALWALAFATSGLTGIHGPAYWDAGDYVRLALEGGQSGMLLGRPIFLFISRLVLETGVSPVHAEPVLRWFWCAVAAMAPAALAALAARLGLSRPAAIAAGVALALSPSFAHTAHQVLTDAPSLALAILALLAAARAQAALAGVLLAAAILTRETAAIHAVAVGVLLGRRAWAAFAAAAAVMASTLWMFPPPAFDAWMHAMSRSVQQNPVGAWQIAAPLVWILAAGPLPVIVGAVVLARRPAGRWTVVSWPALAGTVAILFYPDGWFSPRYMLATVPLAFFLPAAAWLAARPRLAAAGLLVPLVVLAIASAPARAASGRASVVMARVAALPARALVVPGHYCAPARLGAVIHGRGDLEMMCPGWDWPADPALVLGAALSAGRPVALDLGDDAWISPLERSGRAAVEAWAAGRARRGVAGFVVIER